MMPFRKDPSRLCMLFMRRVSKVYHPAPVQRQLPRRHRCLRKGTHRSTSGGDNAFRLTNDLVGHHGHHFGGPGPCEQGERHLKIVVAVPAGQSKLQERSPTSCEHLVYGGDAMAATRPQHRRLQPQAASTTGKGQQRVDTTCAFAAAGARISHKDTRPAFQPYMQAMLPAAAAPRSPRPLALT
jgi:hypothetical protein